VAARLRRVLDGAYANREEIEHRFGEQRLRDAAARRGHLIVACGFCLLVGSPITVMEVAGVILIAVFLLRLPRVAGLWIHGVGQPPYLLLTAWAAWWVLGLSWSSDRAHGLDELANLRWMLIPMAIWPVMDGRRWLVWALAAGFVFGYASQVWHGIGRALEVEWMTFDRLPTRNSGWWDPVVGGSLLCAALGLHLPPAAFGRGRERWIGLAGVAATLAALLATGTRGAWAGGVCLLGMTGLIVAWRVVRERSVRARLPLAACAAALLVGVFVAAFSEAFRERASAGVSEVRRVLVEGDFDSDTGGRLLMWRQGVRQFLDAPLAGSGTGAYESRARAALPEDERWLAHRIHGHAHSAALHAAATGGLVGLLLGAGVIGAGVWGGLRRNPGEQRGGYDAGPAFALMGLAFAGAFDTIQVNAQTAAMLGLLLGLCLPVRPRPVVRREPTSKANLADGLE